MRLPYIILLTGFSALTISGMAAAETTPAVDLRDSNIYADSLAALTMLFVIAVLLENAFATIFNWRVFLTYFSSRGVKTIIMVAIAYALVRIFDLDIVAALIAAYQKGAVSATEWQFPSQLITALILAGGSAGVYNIMYALGYRNERREQELAATPPDDKAWVAFRVNRVKAAGDVVVKIKENGQAAATAPAPIAGTIGFRTPSLRELLLRNRNRFPENGGYTLKANTVYAIAIEAKDGTGQPLPDPLNKEFVFAPRAIVDFNLTM